MAADDKTPPPHYLDHRKRMRQKFLDHAGAGLADYELLELLLFAAIPRRDVKPLAKDLLRHYGSLAKIFAADAGELTRFPLLGEQALVLIKLVRELSLRQIKAEAQKEHILSSWQSVLDYCRLAMAHEKAEQLRILFLNSRNQLIADEVLHRGTINHTPVYPREVVKRALELAATAIIMVHNHPSGDPVPSGADIEVTKLLKNALNPVEIELHDHIIITDRDYSSMKALGLI